MIDASDGSPKQTLAAIREDSAAFNAYLARWFQETVFRLRRIIGSQMARDDLEDWAIALLFDGLRFGDLTGGLGDGSQRILVQPLLVRLQRALEKGQPIYDLDGWTRARITFLIKSAVEVWSRRAMCEPLPPDDELPADLSETAV